jgi:catechol 2,3-dioxygenase-like lactoylglutathione lyase family enzyme
MDATRGGIVPAMPIHHVDLAVTDVERSLAFYRALLDPLGWTKELRFPTYRGTEEVVYLHEPKTRTGLGLRPADDREYRYYSVGIEHLAFEVDERDEVDAAYPRCLAQGGEHSFPSRGRSRHRGLLRILRLRSGWDSS